MPRGILPDPKKSESATTAEAKLTPENATGKAAERPREARPSPGPQPAPRAGRDRRPLRAGGHGRPASGAKKCRAGRGAPSWQRTPARTPRSATSNVGADVRAAAEAGSAPHIIEDQRAARRHGRRKRSIADYYRPCANRGPPEAQPDV
jgi:hypothetical protein